MTPRRPPAITHLFFSTGRVVPTIRERRRICHRYVGYGVTNDRQYATAPCACSITHHHTPLRIRGDTLHVISVNANIRLTERCVMLVMAGDDGAGGVASDALVAILYMRFVRYGSTLHRGRKRPYSLVYRCWLIRATALYPDFRCLCSAFDDYRNIEHALAQSSYARSGNNYKLSRTIATTS